MKNINIKENILSDPLKEFGQPAFAEALKITHHSVTSLHYPDGIYAFRYIFCRQEDRRNFESNSNMMGGVAVGVLETEHKLLDRRFAFSERNSTSPHPERQYKFHRGSSCR